MTKVPTKVREIQQRVYERQDMKRKMDKDIKMSESNDDNAKHFETQLAEQFSEGKKIRLLDEGIVLMGDNWPYMIIAKGSLQKFYDELSEDFIGSINLGHNSFVSMPIVLGTWTKKDLSIVDIGNERIGIDIELHLDDEVSMVKDIRRQALPLGISAEFMAETVAFEKVDNEQIPVCDNIVIDEIGVVGAPGNATSYSESLGDESMSKEDKKKLADEQAAAAEAQAAKDAETTEEVEETTDVVDTDEADGKDGDEDVDKDIEEAAEAAEKAAEELAELKAEKAALETKLAEVEKERDEAIAATETAEKSAEKFKASATKLRDSIRKSFGVKLSNADEEDREDGEDDKDNKADVSEEFGFKNIKF